MSFRALRFDVAAADADAWSDALLEAGALSVDLADSNADTASESPIYAEPGAEASPWPTTRVNALFEASHDVEALLRDISAQRGVAVPAADAFEVADQDWVRATQAQFEPVRITDRLWIVPSWRTPVVPEAVNLVLDPGLAFGTGSHPTTRLCLRWLAEQSLQGLRVLDYGCGSGILAIAAARLGAAEVTAVDVDPQALTATADNAERNGVRLRVALPDDLARDAFHVVVANILANPLRLLAPAIAHRVRPGGALLLSGVLDDQGEAVTAAYASWFRMRRWQGEEGWVTLLGERLRVP